MRRPHATAFLLTFAALSASGAAYAAPTIDVDGMCPDVTVTLEGASASGDVMVFAGAPGSSTLTSGACAGTTLDVADAEVRGHILFTATASAGGAVTVTPARLGAVGCGASVQGLDLATCSVTDAVPLALDCSSLDDGLLAFWPGNDHARDVVGAHRGTIEGTLSYAPGVFGDAFDFDGASAIRVTPTADLQFGDGVPFTFAMSIYDKTTSTAPHHLFGMRGGCGGGVAFDYQYVVQFGYQGGGSYTCGAAASPQPPLNEWQHVISSYDGTAWSLYLDGALASAGTICNAGDMPLLGGPLRIGSSGTCEPWLGLIDEVMLWTRTLDDDEIACVSSPRLRR